MMDNHRETTDIILRYMKHQLDADGFNCPIQFDIQSTESHISEDIHAKVRQLTEDFELKFLETYGDVWTYLDIDNSSEESHELSIEMLTMIHHSLFAEGISWGKIVGLVSLSGSFTRKCIRMNKAELINPGVKCTLEYFENHLNDWMINHGGWKGFMDFFSEANIGWVFPQIVFLCGSYHRGD